MARFASLPRHVTARRVSKQTLLDTPMGPQCLCPGDWIVETPVGEVGVRDRDFSRLYMPLDQEALALMMPADPIIQPPPELRLPLPPWPSPPPPIFPRKGMLAADVPNPEEDLKDQVTLVDPHLAAEGAGE